MKIEEDLKNFKKIFDKELEQFLNLKIRQAGKISPVAYGMVGTLKKYILQSGKRIRPALMYYTYIALGGKNVKQAMQAAMATEFMHTFLIIHDDIIDRDNLRRGNPSVHYFYRRSAEGKFTAESGAIHYGNSQAISVGNMAFSFANEVIAESGLEEPIKGKLFKKISNIIFNTTIGEFYDVSAVLEKNISEKNVLIILEYKTARYTVEGPIHLGAILAGADKKTMKGLSNYSIPLGIAYQIQDDILGIFGSEKQTGKPVGADIKEGKKTLLIAKALEFGNTKQKEEINSALGNQKISNGKIEKICRIVKQTGSLEYSQDLAKKLSYKSNAALEKSGLNEKSKIFFAKVADFIISRNY